MTDAADYLLAVSTTQPDLVFGTIGSVAREIHRRREALPGRPSLSLTTADVWRGDTLRGGAAVAVRVKDGAENGYGSFLAYVFMPRTEHPCRRLAEAIAAIPGNAPFRAAEKAAA